MPKKLLADRCRRRRFLTLRDIVGLASEWNTSITSMAIRYAESAPEPCAIVLSESGHVRYYVPSEDAAYRGFRWLGVREIPRDSATAETGEHQGSGESFERRSDSEVWFSERHANCELWEAAFPLGYTGLVVTMLAFNMDDSKD